MILSDSHMHSEFSSDSDAPMEEMIKAAIDRGLKIICFTDHMDYDYPRLSSNSSEEPLDFLFDPDSYFKKLQRLQQIYSPQIDVRIGIELGLKSQIQSQVRKLMEQYDFDFAIGSSHLLYGKDPYYQSFWEDQGCILTPGQQHSIHNGTIVKRAIHDYFEEILRNLDLFPWFQVYGHLDYIVRYAPGKGAFYQPKDEMELLEAILKKLIATNRGIELNTSGLKSGLSYPNPHTDILKLYRELGGELITIGSDAHTPDHVSYEFTKAEAILQDCGFRYYTTFKNKIPEFHPLDS